MKELYDYLTSMEQNQMNIALNGDTEVFVTCKQFPQWFELKITPSEVKGQKYKINMKMELPAWLSCNIKDFEVNLDHGYRVEHFLERFINRIYSLVVHTLRDNTIDGFLNFCTLEKIFQLKEYTCKDTPKTLLSEKGYHDTTPCLEGQYCELQSDTDLLKVTVDSDNYIITDTRINENLMNYYGLKATTPEEVINIVVRYKNHKLEGYKSKF